ncbi:MAG: site-specific integrase, partial [Solirubrobacterales bacterium]
MARRATGKVIATQGKRGTSYALRFTAYGKRRYVTVGTREDGMTPERADRELQHVLADVERGIWQPVDK